MCSVAAKVCVPVCVWVCVCACVCVCVCFSYSPVCLSSKSVQLTPQRGDALSLSDILPLFVTGPAQTLTHSEWITDSQNVTLTDNVQPLRKKTCTKDFYLHDILLPETVFSLLFTTTKAVRWTLFFLQNNKNHIYSSSQMCLRLTSIISKADYFCNHWVSNGTRFLTLMFGKFSGICPWSINVETHALNSG